MGLQNEGMISDLVRNIQSDSPQLRMLCARAIFRLGEEGETRDLVRYNGGLDPLVAMLSDPTNHNDMVRQNVENIAYNTLPYIAVLCVCYNL